jgi:hypothetical protein
MNRRNGLILASAIAIVTLAVLAAQREEKTDFAVLAWANKAKDRAPPLAVLVEMGLRDAEPRDWSGKITVTGATVVHREGYRFRPADKLTGPVSWTASSHWGLRVPPRNPAVRALESIATVGVVLHLGDVARDAALEIQVADVDKSSATVALKEVLAGTSVPLWNGKAVVRLVSTAAPIAAGPTEDDHPAAAYGPDGTLWIAYVSYTIKDESSRVEQHPFAKEPANFKALYTPGFGDQLFVRYLENGRWSKPVVITGAKEDLVRCAVAVEGDGTVWVVYSAHRKGQFNIFGRALELRPSEDDSHPAPRIGEEEQLSQGGPNLSPVMCTDQNGTVHLAYQSWKKGQAGIALSSCARGKWKSKKLLMSLKGGENMWHPALAAGPAGQVAVAYDTYRDGDYDVHAIVDVHGKKPLGKPIAALSRFEARPAIAYDARGRLWIAYEEGPERWGKDFGALGKNDGKPLYNERSARVACLDGDRLLRPAAALPTSENPPPMIPFDIRVATRFEKTPRYAYPKIGIDGKGRVWLTYRQKFGTRYTSHPGSYWLTFARRLDGDQWSAPVEIHHSDGLLDHRPVLLPHPSGGLRIVHNTDGRYTTPEHIGNQVYVSTLSLAGEAREPKLLAHNAGAKDPRKAAKEKAALDRIRKHRIEVGGKNYQLLRGEFHRHTEISWDGGPDGSLEDMFRYAIDGAGMDWIGNGDHDNGAGREYAWWLIQKFTDAYHVPRAFTPLFCYERSVSYPHGHRNCLFVQRGVRTLPRLAEADPRKRVGGIHADDTKMLYRYLKEHRGICAVHTSATGMGTDWRDNDPEVEPLVEIYQGDRMSYEHEGAPRAGYDPKTKKEPANIAGWYPKGFINLALAKGYRLGFESSSDHWSTHISFCVAVAETHDRQGIMDALRKRHSYAATDNIIVDFRSGLHLMGDEFKTGKAPTLEMSVIGTSKIARIDVLKDGEVAATIKPDKGDYEGTWTDPEPREGVHSYYMRVVQADGELAWASPMWIDYSK